MSDGLVILLITIAFFAGYLIGSKNKLSGKSSNNNLGFSNIFSVQKLDMLSRQEILQLLQENKKIQAIKRCREMTGCGLKEAKEMIEQIEHDEYK